MAGVLDYQTRLTCECGFDGYVASNTPYMQALRCPVCGAACAAFADDAPLSVLRKINSALCVIAVTDAEIRAAMDAAQIDASVSVETFRSFLQALADDGLLTSSEA